MENIDFSKEGKALLKNPELADYLLDRLSKLTPEEKDAGKIKIEVTDGKKNYFLEFQFAPEKTIKGLAYRRSPQPA